MMMRTMKHFEFNLGEPSDDCVTQLQVNIPEVVDPQYGMFAWPAAPILANYIFQNQETFQGKHLLEIGAGPALPGIVAAKIGAKVTLSDAEFYPNCIQNCVRSCEANNLSHVVNVVPISWGLVDEVLLNLGKVDIILGSDCFYDQKDFEDIIYTVAFLIDRNPACRFITSYQLRSQEYSIENLLKKWNLTGKRLPLSSHFEGDTISESKYDIQLFEICKKLYRSVDSCDDEYAILDDSVFLSPGGEFPMPAMEKCSHLCQTVPPTSSSIIVNQAYILNDLCFCTNQTIQIQTCPLANPCAVITTTCPVQLVSTQPFKPTDHKVNFEVVIPDVLETMVPAEIRVFSKTAITISLSIGNRTWSTFATELVTMVTFQTSGYHCVKIGFGNAEEVEEMFLYVHSNVSNVRSAGNVETLEINQTFHLMVAFDQGTNVLVDVEMKINGEMFEKVSFVGDSLEFQIGSDNFDDFEPATLNCDKCNMVMVLEPFLEDSVISSINVQVQEVGQFQLLILRPSCRNDICVAPNKELIDLTSSGGSPEVNDDADGWKVIQEVTLTAIKPGFTTFSLHQQNVKVFKNDVMAIALVDKRSVIQFEHSKVKQTRLFQQQQQTFQVDDEISIKNTQEISSYVPLISIITFCPFTAPLPQLVPMVTGELSITATFQDGRYNRKSITKTYKIQHQLANLTLSLSFVKEIGRYLAVTEVDGNVTGTYEFYIEPLKERIITTNRSIYFDGVGVSGMIRVSVTAANNISSLNATNQIRAIERIRDIQSEAENPVVNLDEYVVVGVKVFGGAYGVVMVIFEDDINITFTKYFLHKLHENTSTLHFSHRYSSCGYKKIRTSVKNEITQRIDGKELEIFVASPISNDDIVVTTYPRAVDDLVTLPIFRNLSLMIHLLSGSFPVYNVSWGDSTFDIIDASIERSPRNVSFIHQYNQPFVGSNQLLKISACNQFSCGERHFPVKVSKCGPPLLSIDREPIVLKRDQMHEIFLKWKNFFQECTFVKWDEYFGFHISELNMGNKSYLAKIQSRIEQHSGRVRLTIPPYIFREGKMVLNFTMRSATTVDKYSLEMIVLPATVKATILGGDKKIEQRLDYVRNQFTMLIFNASNVGDTDEDKSSMDVDDFEFKWFCRLSPSSYSVNVSVYQICSKTNWTELNATGPVMSLSSEHLASKREYQFKVVVTKEGHLPGEAVQSMKISSSQLPKGVQIICKSNCMEEMNAQEQLILNYHCADCPPNSKFIYKWSAYDDKKNKLEITPEFSSTGITKENLAINANQLPKNSEFVVVLEISYQGEEDSSSFEYPVKTSQSPSDGFCSVSNTSLDIMTLLNFTCYGWGPINDSFSYDLMIKTKDIFIRIVSDKVMTSEKIVGHNIQLPLGNMTIVIRIKNRFQQYVDYEVAMIEVYMLLHEDPFDLIEKILKRLPKDHVGSANFAVLSLMEYEEKNTPSENVIKENNMKIRGMIVDNLKESFDKNTKPDHMVAEGLKRATGTIDELSPDTMNKAVELTSVLSSGLTKITTMDENARKTVNSLMNVVGNLMDGQVGMASDGKEKETSENSTLMAKKSTENIGNLVSSVDGILSMVAKNQFVGQGAAQGKTGTFGFTVNKFRSNDLGDQVLSGFKMPKGISLNSTDEGIGTVQVDYKKNIFMSDNSKFIGSKVSSLSLKTAGGEDLQVSGLEHPIEIRLENQEDLLEGTPIEFFIPGYLVTHTVQLQSDDCILMLHVEPPDDLDKGTVLNILVQYAKPPTRMEHDLHFLVDEYGNTTVILDDDHHEEDPNNSTGEEHSEEERKERGKKLLTHMYMVEHTVMIWDWHKFKYGHLNNSKVYFVMWYEGIIPFNKKIPNNYTYDILEEHHHYKYNLKAYCVQCTFWDVHTNSWETDGCEVVPEETDMQYTVCHCNHLTAFSSMMVPPNPLPRLTLALFKEGYVLFVVVGSILGLYLVGLVVLRKFDKKDELKVGGCLLKSNRKTDSHFYRITISTGSATNSRVFIKIYGSKHNSRRTQLHDENRRTFQSNSSDTFILSTREAIGEIVLINIYHNNSSGSWFLREIEIEDLKEKKVYFFKANRWLAVEKGDGKVSCNLTPTMDEELSKDTSYLFFTKLRQDLLDGHIWFSLVGRPPRSIFTRCQRLSVAVCMLLTTMLANVIFYGTLPKQGPAIENNTSNIAFSLKKIYIAVISSLIGVPVNVVLTLLYRRIRPSPKVPDELKPYTDKQVEEKNRDLKKKCKAKRLSALTCMYESKTSNSPKGFYEDRSELIRLAEKRN